MWRRITYLLFGVFMAVMLAQQNRAMTLTPIPAPDVQGAPWLNSAPLTLSTLKGQVVLVEFWTFGCYNCRHVEPYIKQWFQRYHQQGLQVIGVHTPEFDYERIKANVQDYINANEINYPVVMDNDYTIWNRYHNRYWPAIYLIDHAGQLRYLKVGEGDYAATEHQIQLLLKEKSASNLPK